MHVSHESANGKWRIRNRCSRHQRENTVLISFVYHSAIYALLQVRKYRDILSRAIITRTLMYDSRQFSNSVNAVFDKRDFNVTTLELPARWRFKDSIKRDEEEGIA